MARAHKNNGGKPRSDLVQPDTATQSKGSIILRSPDKTALILSEYVNGLSPQEIADRHNYDPRTVIGALAVLESKGQIQGFRERTKAALRAIVTATTQSLLMDAVEGDVKARTVLLGVTMDKLAVAEGEPTAIVLHQHEMLPPTLDVGSEVLPDTGPIVEAQEVTHAPTPIADRVQPEAGLLPPDPTIQEGGGGSPTSADSANSDASPPNPLRRKGTFLESPELGAPGVG